MRLIFDLLKKHSGKVLFGSALAYPLHQSLKPQKTTIGIYDFSHWAVPEIGKETVYERSPYRKFCPFYQHKKRNDKELSKFDAYLTEGEYFKIRKR